MPAGDLCTLANVQSYLTAPSSGTAGVLAMLITQVSDWVQGYCERRFDGINTYIWLTDGRGGDTLPLPERPVGEVLSVVADGVSLSPSCYLVDDHSITLQGGVFRRGRKNVQITYTAGFPYVFTPGVDGAPDTITGLPPGLSLAVIQTVCLRFQRRGSLGNNSEGMTGQTTSYDKDIAPKDAMAIFNKYRKNIPW